MAAKVDLYRLCVRWSRCGSSGGSVFGRKVYVVGWVCRRDLLGNFFAKFLQLGHCDGILLGLVNGCELRLSDWFF